MKPRTLVYFTLSLFLLGCNTLGEESKIQELQMQIEQLEQQFPVLTANCFFEDKGESLIVVCPNSSQNKELTVSKDQDTITTAACGSGGCSYTNWSNPEFIEIKKSKDLTVYSYGRYRQFHACISSMGPYTYDNFGETQVVSVSQYGSLFTQDVELCDALKVNYDRVDCFACVAKNSTIEFCEQLSGEYQTDYDWGSVSNRDMCIRKAAPLMDDLSNCYTINNPTQEQWCILEFAEKHKNISICDGISDRHLNNMCKSRVNPTTN